MISKRLVPILELEAANISVPDQKKSDIGIDSKYSSVHKLAKQTQEHLKWQGRSSNPQKDNAGQVHSSNRLSGRWVVGYQHGVVLPLFVSI